MQSLDSTVTQHVDSIDVVFWIFQMNTLVQDCNYVSLHLINCRINLSLCRINNILECILSDSKSIIFFQVFLFSLQYGALFHKLSCHQKACKLLFVAFNFMRCLPIRFWTWPMQSSFST